MKYYFPKKGDNVIVGEVLRIFGKYHGNFNSLYFNEQRWAPTRWASIEMHSELLINEQ